MQKYINKKMRENFCSFLAKRAEKKNEKIQNLLKDKGLIKLNKIFSYQFQ